MEIEIDFEAVRRLTAEEYAQARQEIDELGVMAAFERSQQRHDARLAAAADAPTLACKAGCSWCCHFSVDVRAVEALQILDFMRRHFSTDDQGRMLAQIRQNSLEVAPLTDLERMKRTQRCVFLADGRCAIYPVRPQTCRNYHATDAAGCKQSFEEPENLDIDPEFAPLVYQAGGAHVDAFSRAMQHAGYDVAAYELNIALAAAAGQPQSRERFEAGLAPFEGISGEDVPTEFMEED